MFDDSKLLQNVREKGREGRWNEINNEHAPQINTYWNKMCQPNMIYINSCYDFTIIIILFGFCS